jgi:hypothetical protein
MPQHREHEDREQGQHCRDHDEGDLRAGGEGVPCGVEQRLRRRRVLPGRHRGRAGEALRGGVLGPDLRRNLVENGRFAVTPVEGLGPEGTGDVDAVVTATPEVLAGLLYDGLDLDDALASDVVQLEGDREAFARYLACFWLPEPAPLPSG